MDSNNLFIESIQNSGVKEASVNVIVEYVNLFYNMFATGGISGLVSFFGLLFLCYFVIDYFVPLKIPKIFVGTIATLIVVLTAPFVLLPLYVFVSGLVGV